MVDRNDLELLTLSRAGFTEPGFLVHQTSTLQTELYPSLSFKTFTSYFIQERQVHILPKMVGGNYRLAHTERPVTDLVKKLTGVGGGVAQ